MDLRQLRYFAQIVESGSLSKASRQLFIAQPALSQQLSKLEGEIGKPLLTRSSKGVAPTENGLALYHHARFMLRQLDQALSIARKESGAVHGMVSVGLPTTTVSALGLPLVRRIRERYPSILLNVVEGMSGHLGQMMRMGQLDLAVLFASDIAPDMTVRALLEEELFVMLPRRARPAATDCRRIRATQFVGAHRRRDRFAVVVDELRLPRHGRHHQADGRHLPRRRARQEMARTVRVRCAHEPAQLPVLPAARAAVHGRRRRRHRTECHRARTHGLGRLDRRGGNHSSSATVTRTGVRVRTSSAGASATGNPRRPALMRSDGR